MYMLKTLTLALSLAVLTGCTSATALRCGTDGQSSFVEIYDIPQGFAQNTRAYAQLCAFSYDQEVSTASGTTP